MNVDQLFPSKYLKAEDFAEGEVRILTIRAVEQIEIGEKKELKGLMTFRDAGAKPLVLNKTNTAIVAKFYGKETDDWMGKKIALRVMEVEMKGDIVQAIRVATKQPAAQPAPKPQASTIDAEDELFADEPAASMNLKPGGVPIPSHQR
jgi:hypothetical protein